MDVVNCAYFYRNRLRGLDFVEGGRILNAMSPLTLLELTFRCDDLIWLWTETEMRRVRAAEIALRLLDCCPCYINRCYGGSVVLSRFAGLETTACPIPLLAASAHTPAAVDLPFRRYWGLPLLSPSASAISQPDPVLCRRKSNRLTAVKKKTRRTTLPACFSNIFLSIHTIQCRKNIHRRTDRKK